MEEEAVLDQEVAQDAIHSEDVTKDKKAKKKEKVTRKQSKNQEKKVEETKACDLENDESLQERDASLSEDKENKEEIDLYSEKKEIIKVENLTIAYGSNVLMQDISFEVKEGDVFIIMGGSGCGKSSLLRMLTGLKETEYGKIWIDGKRFDTIKNRQCKSSGHSVQMVRCNVCTRSSGCCC